MIATNWFNYGGLQNVPMILGDDCSHGLESPGTLAHAESRPLSDHDKVWVPLGICARFSEPRILRMGPLEMVIYGDLTSKRLVIYDLWL